MLTDLPTHPKELNLCLELPENSPALLVLGTAAIDDISVALGLKEVLGLLTSTAAATVRDDGGGKLRRANATSEARSMREVVLAGLAGE